MGTFKPLPLGGTQEGQVLRAPGPKGHFRTLPLQTRAGAASGGAARSSRPRSRRGCPAESPSRPGARCAYSFRYTRLRRLIVLQCSFFKKEKRKNMFYVCIKENKKNNKNAGVGASRRHACAAVRLCGCAAVRLHGCFFVFVLLVLLLSY